LIARSREEETKLATDQEAGFMLGSRRRYERRKRGVEVDIRVGSVDVRKVMGRRWAGIR
jgi:hypothetical protein